MSLVNLAHVCSHLQNASLARLGLTSIPYTKMHLSIALLLQKQGFFSTVDLAGANPPLSRYAPGTQRPEKQTSLSSKLQSQDRETALLRLIRRREKAEREHQIFGSARPLADDVSVKLDEYITELEKSGFDKDDLQWAKSMSHLTREQLSEDGVEVEAMGLNISGQPLAQDAQTIDPEDGVVTRENRASRRLWLGLKYWQGEPVLRKAKMISKPTKRIWLGSQDLADVIKGRNAGEVKGMKQLGEVVVVSTDRGMMEARECAERQIGGQPLIRVW